MIKGEFINAGGIVSFFAGRAVTKNGRDSVAALRHTSFFIGGAGAGFFLLPPFFSLAEGGKPAKIWNMVS